MLCFQCRRLVTTAVRRQKIAIPLPLPPSPPQASRPLLRSPSVVRATRGLASSKLSRTIQLTSAPRYSTSSDATAASPAPSQTPSSAGPEKPDYFDDAESEIWDTLVAEFAPTELTVQDISGGCGSMYGIEIASDKFRGVNMLKQQRMVNAVLGDRMKGWHGLQLRTKIPSS
ncbi:bola-like protein [Camillea tinctor]|nr:bola-like protein [Camillea tinctor]